MCSVREGAGKDLTTDGMREERICGVMKLLFISIVMMVMQCYTFVKIHITFHKPRSEFYCIEIVSQQTSWK